MHVGALNNMAAILQAEPEGKGVAEALGLYRLRRISIVIRNLD
eukprot:COSAG01_NODE_30466_length_615_cov_1.199612_2_plen_43_part_00